MTMKKRITGDKGFTLIELIGVIAVLAIILMVSLPALSKMLKKYDEQKYETVLKDLYLATEQYTWNFREYFPTLENINGEATVSFKTLKEAGYIRSRLENPKTKKYFLDTDYILVHVNGDHTRNYLFNGGSGEIPSVDIVTPTYTITPSGDTWAQEKTVTIHYQENKQPNFVYEYSKDGGSSWEVSYETEKKILYKENGTLIARVRDLYNEQNTVTARVFTITKIDNTKPTIIVGSNLTIVQGSTYNTLTGVSASDVAGIKSLTTSITNTNTLGVGTHTITYTAIDNAGNKNTATKKIKVVRKTDSLIKNGYQEYGDNTNFSYFQYISENGTPLFRITSSEYQMLESSELIPVDTSKKYYQEATIRTNQTSAIYYIGITEYDVDKKLISADHVGFIPNTTTSLTRDLKNGDTIVYLNNTTNFIDTTLYYQNGFIIWDYKDSTGYTYPAEVYSRHVWYDLYTSASINRTNHTITLKQPWSNGTIPTGTKLSQSSSGSNFNYGCMTEKMLSSANTWTTCSNRIQGTNKWYEGQLDSFRIPTKYIRFLALNNYQNNWHPAVANTITDYRNLIFKQIDS